MDKLLTLILKENEQHRESIITMLRFLSENRRNRSNSRQLSEILFFVKIKHQKKRKTTYMDKILKLILEKLELLLFINKMKINYQVNHC
jgi:hypothetical protein